MFYHDGSLSKSIPTIRKARNISYTVFELVGVRWDTVLAEVLKIMDS
jgi:hypothetical protein